MLAFPNVVYLFANEFTSLSRWRFTSALGFACAFDRGFFRH